jgi:hypothetical protein
MADDLFQPPDVFRFLQRVEANLPDTFDMKFQPSIGDTHPDAVVISQDGLQSVLEIKLGSGLLHIADLAQVVAYRDALANVTSEEGNPQAAPSAVLVTNLKGSALIDDAAAKLHVKIVGPDRTNAELAAKAADYLKGLDPASIDKQVASGNSQL